jgi:hypothetical protein
MGGDHRHDDQVKRHADGGTDIGKKRPAMPTPYAVVSVDRRASDALLAELKAVGLPPAPIFVWGDANGYSWLIHDAARAVLLDLPRYSGLEAGFQVAALSTLGPVFVLASGTVDAVEVLGAGGRGYVDRNRPIADIASTVVAHLGVGRAGIAVPTRPGLPFRQPYRFMLEWLLDRPGEFSCHQLRWLLGRAGRPLSLVDVRAKLRRIEPALRTQGRAIRQISHSDNASFLVESVS